MDRTNDWRLLPGMFFRPRRTIAAIVADQRYAWVIALAVIGGVFDAFVRASDVRPEMTLGVALAAATVVGGIGGVVMLYLTSWLVGTCGRWFGARAPGSELRAALAWGRVPFLAAGLVFIAKLACFGWGGEEVLLDQGTQVGAIWASLGLNLLMVVFALWSLVSTVAATSEVQGISSARTVGSFLLAGVVAGVFALAFVFVVAAIRG